MTQSTRHDHIVSPATLDRWDTTVELAHTPEGLVATYTVTGRCKRRRKALWVYSETLPVARGSFALHDAVLHVQLACEQDRPNTMEKLERALFGARMGQRPLDFE